MLFDKTFKLIERDNLGGIFSYAIHITNSSPNNVNDAVRKHGSFFGRPDLRAEVA